MYSALNLFVVSLFIIQIAQNVQPIQCQVQQQNQREQQQQQHSQEQQQQSTQRHSYVPNHGGRNVGFTVTRFNRTAPNHSSSTGVCEYKELIAQLHDRVSVLVSLDEHQRDRLSAIDKKIVQFEESNLARLDSMGVHQMEANKQLDSIEHMHRLTARQLEELKEDLRLLQQQQQGQQHQGCNNDFNIQRPTRQANTSSNSNPNTMSNRDLRLDLSAKLDALSVWLTSTRISINNLHMQLAQNLTRLMQTTSNLQRRFNNLSRRQQNSAAGYPLCSNVSPGVAVSRPSGTSGFLEPLICTYIGPDDSLGIQRVQLANSVPFYAACDDKIQGGGWTVIQSRYSGEINFQRDWLEYKTGFGNLAGEFFIGLEKLHELTTTTLHELLILMADEEGEQRYARYSTFAIGDENELYALNLLGAYSGDAGDSLSYHAGSKFSTFDNDNDGWLEGNCALAHTGAWWYNACEKSNLNGQYLKGEYSKEQTFQGMYWEDFRGSTYSLRSVRMMIRPVGATEQDRRR